MKRPAPGRLAFALAAALAIAAPVAAEPLAISAPEDLDRLAALVTAYKDASRVRWVVETADPAARKLVLDGLADRLGPARASLLERVSGAVGDPEANRQVATRSAGSGRAPAALARIEIAPPPARTCSWRVTVADPNAPVAPGEATAIPIERGDIIPTSPDATFEVGFSGPLQSTLYAFAETAPGAVRDLAASRQIAIPVEAAATETLVLVRARRPVPFLDGIRSALGVRQGGRGDLGANASLAERFRNGGRGIGANIQLVDPGMIVAQAEIAPTVAPDPVRPAADPLRDPDGGALARNDDLVETCLYTVTRLPD